MEVCAVILECCWLFISSFGFDLVSIRCLYCDVISIACQLYFVTLQRAPSRPRLAGPAPAPTNAKNRCPNGHRPRRQTPTAAHGKRSFSGFLHFYAICVSVLLIVLLRCSVRIPDCRSFELTAEDVVDAGTLGKGAGGIVKKAINLRDLGLIGIACFECCIMYFGLFHY